MTNIVFKVLSLPFFDSATNQQCSELQLFAEDLFSDFNAFIYVNSANVQPGNPYPVYNDIQTAAASTDGVACANTLLAATNSYSSTPIYSSYSLLFGINSYEKAVVDADIAAAIAAIPAAPAKSFATPTRTIGTAFQISTTRDASVVYSIPVTSNATLVAGSQASASLQYADNSAMTTNLVTLPGDAFGVASGLLVSGIGSLKLLGTVPAGKWVKITTTNISGTPTLGTMTAQEVLL